MSKLTVIVPFSGGKDSQASLIWAAKQYGEKNIKAIFCDTGWEHELTPIHVQNVCEQMGVELIILKSKKYDGMVDLAAKKKRFPSRKAQFCTEELKVKPQIDWILDELKSGFLLIDGRRKDESESRSNLDEFCTYFKYYTQPYGTDKDGKPKYLSYRKKEVMQFIEDGHANEVIRPFVNNTANEVIEYILQNNQKPNDLYYMGFSRVGCMPCINAKLMEVELMAKVATTYVERVIDAEKQVGSTFFAPKKIPERYCSKVVKTEEGTTKVPTMEDVVKYTNFMNAQTELFQEPPTGHCMSFYNICE